MNDTLDKTKKRGDIAMILILIQNTLLYVTSVFKQNRFVTL